MTRSHAELRTARLFLRAFRPADAHGVARLAGDEAIARGTLNVPHPYGAGQALQWISTLADELERGVSITWAITRRSGGGLLGAVGLVTEGTGRVGELGYWIGRPYWGNGYATEAGRAVLDWGFRHRGLRRVFALHFSRNPASGAVLRKLGMRHEGRLRHHVVKDGERLDVELYGAVMDMLEPAGRLVKTAGHY